MAEAKALIWVLNYIGVPVSFLAWGLNSPALLNILHNLLQITVNPAIAAVVGVIGIFFALAKLVVFCVTSYQNIQMRQMKLRAEKKKLNSQQ